MRGLAIAPLLLLALLAAAPGTPARAKDAPEAPAEAISGALEDLTSPAERVRKAAVRRLGALLPASREAVQAALSAASPAAKALLIEVLVADGSVGSVRKVLGELERADDILATQLLQLVVKSPDATASAEAIWQREPTLAKSPRARALARLIRRMETERLFLGRKSRSGSTGSYRGQYEVLRPYRVEALDLCLAIILDRALPVPGVYASGVFEFLRPPSTYIAIDELRSMAAHAFSELAEPSDTRWIRELDAFVNEREREIDMFGYGVDRAEVIEALSRYSDVLIALYLVTKEEYEDSIEMFLWGLRHSHWRHSFTDTYRALVLLRVGRHAAAIREFEMALAGGNVLSRAGTHYNLACAYAQWGGRQEEGVERQTRLAQALRHLEQAVEHQWSDIGWMEEDRDLDPIRDTPRYRALLRRVKEFLRVPGDG